MDPPKKTAAGGGASGVEEKYSTSEIFSDAKYVAGAAKSGFGNQSEKIDKAEAADAAGDLLDAGGQYAKLDDQKGVGQYVDKASDYLHQYKPADTTAAGAGAAHPSKPDQQLKGDAAPAAAPPATEESSGGIAGIAKKGLGGFFS